MTLCYTLLLYTASASMREANAHRLLVTSLSRSRRICAAATGFDCFVSANRLRTRTFSGQERPRLCCMRSQPTIAANLKDDDYVLLRPNPPSLGVSSFVSSLHMHGTCRVVSPSFYPSTHMHDRAFCSVSSVEGHAAARMPFTDMWRESGPAVALRYGW
jgi:hypothetical protein